MAPDPFVRTCSAAPKTRLNPADTLTSAVLFRPTGSPVGTRTAKRCENRSFEVHAGTVRDARWYAIAAKQAASVERGQGKPMLRNVRNGTKPKSCKQAYSWRPEDQFLTNPGSAHTLPFTLPPTGRHRRTHGRQCWDACCPAQLHQESVGCWRRVYRGGRRVTHLDLSEKLSSAPLITAPVASISASRHSSRLGRGQA